jgi:hypothetical protein
MSCDTPRSRGYFPDSDLRYQQIQAPVLRTMFTVRYIVYSRINLVGVVSLRDLWAKSISWLYRRRFLHEERIASIFLNLRYAPYRGPVMIDTATTGYSSRANLESGQTNTMRSCTSSSDF